MPVFLTIPSILASKCLLGKVATLSTLMEVCSAALIIKDMYIAQDMTCVI